MPNLGHKRHIAADLPGIVTDYRFGTAKQADADSIDDLTMGADKGYDDAAFIEGLEERGIDQRVAIKKGAISLSTDGGVTRWLCRP